MTTVVAAEVKKGVIFATDSQVTFGSRRESMSKGKIVKNGPITFAFAGAVRVKNILEHAKLPAPPKSRKRVDIERWAVNHLIPAMRKALREQEAIEVDSSKTDSGSSLLCSVNGRLFEISSDFAVTRNGDNVYAVGSGSMFALGAIYAGAQPREAVAIASYHDVYSGGEIHEVLLKADGTPKAIKGKK